MKIERIRQLHTTAYQPGPILYWMIRDQRAVDNWALIYAQKLAKKYNQPLCVCVSLRRDLSKHAGTRRMIDFMLAGLQEVEKTLKKHHIPFTIVLADTSPADSVAELITNKKIGAVVTDFLPLHEQQSWKKALAIKVAIPIYEVDAHNIIPCWLASSKAEFAARTFRPKVYKQLSYFLDEFPALEKQSIDFEKLVAFKQVDWARLQKEIKVDEAVEAVNWLEAGTTAGYKMLDHFLAKKNGYGLLRNDPNSQAISNLSPYLHFGQISAQQVAIVASTLSSTLLQIPAQLSNKKTSNSSTADIDAFLEELVVRRELADNFCLYAANYTTLEACPQWAQTTLKKHSTDHREYIYSRQEFEQAQTHDPLWNAAQREMVNRGKMHGYMRMYWAKKILEWTTNPADAIAIAIYLNDKYELDGRDPNGYVGILWSIGGLHDRPWFERTVFGQIRYMNANGAQKKFDTQKYIATNS